MRQPHRPSILRTCSGLAALATCLVIISATPALAADSVYWEWAAIPENTTVVAGGISFAGLNGTGGQSQPIAGANVDHPLGTAIDSRSATIYWANFGSSVNYCSGPLNGSNTISFARLDGTEGGILNTSGATVSGPDGLAIDPAAGRLYWANDHANKISYADLRGGGGHDLNTSGASVDCPAGVAVDPAQRRVYWTNFTGNSIAYANLDGSGGGNLNTAGASMSGPYGLAIDSADGRVYWANNTGNSISYAKLDGSGGDDLSAPGATVTAPWGVAIDPSAGRVYWANNTVSTISYANLNESGGGDLNTVGAPSEHPKYPVLLEHPSAAGAPVIGGRATTGSPISCSAGTWAADLPESFLYRAPQRLTYGWRENGIPISGASSTIIPRSPGRYDCRVTAGNYAGSAMQTSAPLTVVATPAAAVSVTSVQVSPTGKILLEVLVHAPGTLFGAATFKHDATRIVGGQGHRHKIRKSTILLYGRASLSASGPGTVLLTIKPTTASLRRLKADKRLRVRLALAFIRLDGAVTRAGVRISVNAP